MWALAELGINYEAVTEGVFKHPEIKIFHPLGRLPALDMTAKGCLNLLLFALTWLTSTLKKD